MKKIFWRRSFVKLSLLMLLLLSLSLGVWLLNLQGQTASSDLYSPQSPFIISASKAEQTIKPMFKLEQLALAMVEVEGWRPAGKTATPGGSRAFRNHNPGNLRSSPFEVGKDGGFSVFKTDMDGWQAMLWDIKQKALGKTTTGLNGEKTLLDLIKVWAPASDNNDPAGYLMQVCKMTGFTATMKLKELLE